MQITTVEEIKDTYTALLEQYNEMQTDVLGSVLIGTSAALTVGALLWFRKRNTPMRIFKQAATPFVYVYDGLRNSKKADLKRITTTQKHHKPPTPS